MPKVFITGASGNVGRPVVSELLSRAYEVTVLAHNNSDMEGCKIVHGKVSEAGKYAGEVAACDAIIHLASTRSVERNVVVSEDIRGTGLLLDSWRKGNFLYMSSQTVYGIPRGPLTERHPLSPVCWYDIAKICCENQLSIEPARPERGVGISFRMALLFGRGGNGRGDQFLETVYPHCARGHVFAFESEEAMETAGSSFVGPRDLACAIVDSLTLKTAGVYNVSSGFCTWRSLISILCKKGGFTPKFSLLSKLPQGAQYVRLPHSKSYVDSSLFVNRTGFLPKQGLNELLDDFLAGINNKRNAGKAYG